MPKQNTLPKRMPPEVIRQVITDCHPDRHKFKPLGRASRRDVMLASHVCKYWREVALSTPVLWSDKISYYFDQNTTVRDMECANAWLSRSGKYPLSFFVEHYHRESGIFSWAPGGPPLCTFQSIIDTLLAYAAQCRSLKFHTNTPPIDALLPIKGNLSILENLDIEWNNDPSRRAWDIFHSTPNLRKLTLDSRMDLRCMRIPWSQLTTCDLGIRTFTEYIAMLPKLPNLIEIKISLPYVRNKIPTDQYGITVLAHVKKLTTFIGPDPSFIWDHLTLPSLVELDLLSYDHNSKWPLKSLTSLIARSSCRVTTLALPLPIVSINDARALFSHTPELATLQVYRYDVHIWRLLARSAIPGQILLPNLKAITLHINKDGDGRDRFSHFAQTLRSRAILTEEEVSAGATQLECFTVRNWNHLWEDELHVIDVWSDLAKTKRLKVVETTDYEGEDEGFREIDIHGLLPFLGGW